MIWRQDCYQLPTGRTSFGFKDGIGQPAVEGSGIPLEPQEPADQGRRDHPRLPRRDRASCRRCRRRRCSAATAPTSSSASCTRSGGLPALPARERREPRGGGAARRQDGRRWQSGAPLALSPERDDPELGADPRRNNDFLYGDDPRGFKCPAGAHARARTRATRSTTRERQRPPPPHDPARHELRPDAARGRARGRRRRPRDHLRLRRRAPQAPVRVRQDPVAQRRHLHRRPAEKDPLVGPNDGSGTFTIPQRPIRRRLQDLPPFVVTRGGEYCFAPACERCAGWPSWTPDRRRRSKRRTTWQRARHAPTAGRHSTSARRRPTSPSPTSPCSSTTSDGRVALITLNRPHADNAITTEMGARLTEIVETIAVRPAVRVVIITGAGERPSRSAATCASART